MPVVAGGSADTSSMYGKKGNGSIPAGQQDCRLRSREQMTKGQAESNLYLTMDSDWIKVKSNKGVASDPFQTVDESRL
jgi:hypothetical protein